jgi:tetrapyrrole methylase family protein/MazG family protein
MATRLTTPRKKKKKPASSKNRSRAAGQPAASNPRSAAGHWFQKLVAIQARLRAPGGCPWDREQSHASLRTHLLEEAYEVLEALEEKDDEKLAEELGDLLLQIIFPSGIAHEQKRFSIVEVIRLIHDKLVRRHPHVFGTKKVRDSAEVLKNWELIKAEERRAKTAGRAGASDGAGKEKKFESLLDGIPKGLPATMEGLQLTRRTARIGFDWETAEGILEKLTEESAELRHAMRSGQPGMAEEEVGDLLFAAVNLARFLKIDPEIALQRANRKFASRFRTMEHLALTTGQQLADVPRAEMERLWEESKREEKSGHPANSAQAELRIKNNGR